MRIMVVGVLLSLLFKMTGCTSKDTERAAPSGAEPRAVELSYAFFKKLEGVSVEEALRRVEDALGANGFGVLTKIDIQDTFKKKIPRAMHSSSRRSS